MALVYVTNPTRVPNIRVKGDICAWFVFHDNEDAL